MRTITHSDWRAARAKGHTYVSDTARSFIIELDRETGATVLTPVRIVPDSDRRGHEISLECPCDLCDAWFRAHIDADGWPHGDDDA